MISEFSSVESRLFKERRAHVPFSQCHKLVVVDFDLRAGLGEELMSIYHLLSNEA